MARIVDAAGREREVLEGFVDFAGKRVLDVGCGDGRTAHWIARTAASVLGIDPDPERIALARGTAGAGGSCAPRFFAEDIVSFDLPERDFDVVVFTRSL